MCGIAGIVAPASDSYLPQLEGMVNSLRHRGPDDSGTYVFPNCALGHTRLSIVDLAGGHQPMLGRDRKTGICFNGEIYGFKQLRQNYADYPFHSTGDTELILAMYERHGESLVEFLPGMFAFAIWDDTNQRLICGRDRFGEKPFYYAFGRKGELVFASEIKAILATGLVQPELDLLAVRQFLNRGYVRPDRTIYRNIHTLPPAHQLTFERGECKIRRYWSLPKVENLISMGEAVEKFQFLLDQAVGRQLVADVPVGAFLSGGLDSSTLVALASRYHQGIKTFSFGFGKVIDELPYAREIAQRYQTEHFEASDQAEDIAGLLHKMGEVYDEPLGDSANIPTYLLTGIARKEVTVALAGEGADELLGGYNFWYRPLLNLERAQGLPDLVATLIRIAALGCKCLGRELPNSLANLWEGFFLKPHYPDALDAHAHRTCHFSKDALDSLGLPFDETIHGPHLPSNESRGLNGAMGVDLETYLPGDILTKTDRASMAWGLEMRCPFLDVDLASFCISLPSRLKINGSRDKLLLREAFANAWTPSIRGRSKQGFGAPVSSWLKQEGMRELKRNIFDNPDHALFDVLKQEAVRGFTSNDNYQTWNLLVLGLWLEKHSSSI